MPHSDHHDPFLGDLSPHHHEFGWDTGYHHEPEHHSFGHLEPRPASGEFDYFASMFGKKAQQPSTAT